MRQVWIRSCVVGIVLLVDAAAAWSRAGGGGGYSDGSSSSSSSSSSYSSGGGSGGAGTEVELIPLFMLILVVVVYLLFSRKRQPRLVSNAVGLARPSTLEPTRKDQTHITTLEETDSEFDAEKFYGRVERAFLGLQQAWSLQDLSRVRGFMSDGLYERFAIQIREQIGAGFRNRMSDVKVIDLSICEVSLAEHFEIVSLRVDASASDWREDLISKKEVPNTRRQERFVEYWTFLRAAGGVTGNNTGLLEGECPNCSALVDPERAWECSSCESVLDSVPMDWVLTEITQASEWRSRSRQHIPGLKGATRTDPGLTLQHLEDRSSLLFWRLKDSDRTGLTTSIASVARPAFMRQQQMWLDAARRHFTGDCAVGSVEVLGLMPGLGWQLALVEVRWAGSVFERREGSRPISKGARGPHRSLLVMARHADAQCTVGQAIVSAHCPNCGGPDQDSIDGACNYCGHMICDGQTWLIDRFLDMNDDEAKALLAECHERADDGLREPKAT